MKMPDLTQLKGAIQVALQSWKAIDRAVPDLLQTLLVVKQHNQGNCLHDNIISWRRAVNEMLLGGIAILAQESSQEAVILDQRFLQGLPAKEVAFGLNLDRDRLNRLQRKGIVRLAQIVWAQEEAARMRYLAEMEERLPNTSHPLFGVEAALQGLVTKVLAQDEPWVMLLTGIGGIGKTSLAVAVVRQALGEFAFEGVVWAQVAGEEMVGKVVFDQFAQQLGVSPTLSPTEQRQEVRRILQACPYLLVVDNVEREGELVTLLQEVGELANPGKILLTARVRPPEVVVWGYGLGELSLTAVSDLIHHLANANNHPAFVVPTAEEIEALYNLAGGNPLAIKLVAGLMPVAPLPVLLADLQQAAIKQTKGMYRHIYWRVWHSLSPEARTVLLSLLLAAGNGFTASHMLAVSKLEAGVFWTAVHLLISRSLLEVRHEKPEWRYGIHRLTASFLQIDIAQL